MPLQFFIMIGLNTALLGQFPVSIHPIGFEGFQCPQQKHSILNRIILQ